MLIRSFYNNYTLDFSNEIYIQHDFVVADYNIYKLYPNLFKEEPILIDAIESKKTVESALEVCKKLLEKNIKKGSKVIVLGGGITQDVCGFAMNILFRGINWTYIPTTLLAQADSCIGSKTSLNLDTFKNIVGTFYPPSNIVINSEFIKTLDAKDYFSGIGEVIKLHLIGGETHFKSFVSILDQLIAKDLTRVQNAVKSCLSIKKQFIEEDELDLNIRQILNFGHTFGHAIESETNYQIPHGIAVMYGIMIANKISLKKGLLSEELYQSIYLVLSKLVSAAGFDPKLLESLSVSSLIEKTKKDKKNTNTTHINMILIDDKFSFQKVPVNIEEIKHII